VPQCDVGSTAETLIIHFDQERFEQLLSRGGTSLLHMRNHRKVSVARASLASSWKQVSIEPTEVPSEPITASREAKQALCKVIKVSTETNLAPHQRVNVVRETIKVPREPTTTSSKVMWVAKSTNSCLDSALCKVKIVSDYETISAPRRLSLACPAKLRLKHFVLTTRLIQPGLHHQHYWVVLGQPLAAVPKH